MPAQRPCQPWRHISSFGYECRVKGLTDSQHVVRTSGAIRQGAGADIVHVSVDLYVEFSRIDDVTKVQIYNRELPE